MAKLKFSIPSPLDSATTYSKIQGFLKAENDFKKFDPSVQCTFEDSNKNCQVKGSQFTAGLKVQDGASGSTSSTIEVQVEIGMALSLFKGKIQEMLEKTVHKVLKS